MEGGSWGGGGGGEGFCDKNPGACSGSNEKYGCNNQGDCSVPAPVQAKMDECPTSRAPCQDSDGTKYYWDANGNFVIESKDGVTTVWEDYIVGGNGGDPNPNDSCTPTGKSCVGSWPSTTQICTYTPCGYVINEPLTCCPAASPPGKATSPVPSDGSTDLTGGLNVTLSVTLPNNWGKNSHCLLDYRNITFYGSSDKAKVYNLDPSVKFPTLYPDPSSGNPASSISVLAAEYDKVYYWRVVTCNGGTNCVASGNDGWDVGNDGVWQFKTAPVSGWWQSQLATLLKRYARFVRPDASNNLRNFWIHEGRDPGTCVSQGK